MTDREFRAKDNLKAKLESGRVKISFLILFNVKFWAQANSGSLDDFKNDFVSLKKASKVLRDTDAFHRTPVMER